jgi:hypothetical protein
MTKKSALTKPCKQRAFMCQPVAFHKLFVQKQELPKTNRNISFKSQGPKFGWSARPRYWECVKPAWLKKMVSCSVFSWSSTQPFGNPNMIVLPKGTNILCSNHWEHCLSKKMLLVVQKHVSKYWFKKCFKRRVSFYALKTYLLMNNFVSWACV